MSPGCAHVFRGLKLELGGKRNLKDSLALPRGLPAHPHTFPVLILTRHKGSCGGLNRNGPLK